MKIKILGGLLMAALAFTSVAKAQTHTPVINAREHRQAGRINQGVRSGQLTRGETHHLRNDERDIRAVKQREKATGHVTANQRRTLRHDENRTSRQIYRDKHNARVQ